MDREASTSGERLLDYTHARLVAVIDAPKDVADTVKDLRSAGFAKAFDVHCGAAGARLIDFEGTEHGPLARLSHALHTLTVEGAHMEHYEKALLEGHCVVMVRTDTAERRQCGLDILTAHGAHFINQFSLLTVETVVP
jgi:hypothetical protein